VSFPDNHRTQQNNLDNVYVTKCDRKITVPKEEPREKRTPGYKSSISKKDCSSGTHKTRVVQLLIIQRNSGCPN
jgi:hypothetical protein